MEPYDWLKDISNLDELMDPNPNKDVSLFKIHTNLTFQGDVEETEDVFAMEFVVRGLPVFLYANKKISLATLAGLKANQWSSLKVFVDNTPLAVDDMHIQNQTMKPLYANLNGTNTRGILYYYLTHYAYANKTKLEKMELISNRFVTMTLNFMGKKATLYAKLEGTVDIKLFQTQQDVKDEKKVTTIKQDAKKEKPWESNPMSQTKVKPIAFLIKAKCDQKKNSIVLGKMVGKGTFSQVSEAKLSADEKTFGYALKVSFLKDPDSDLEILERDNYFLNVLKPAAFGGKPIVPRIIDSWLCNEPEGGSISASSITEFLKQSRVTAYTLLEKWDGDMAFLGEQRTGLRSFAFTKSELIAMFRLAILLGELGVVHGDLKPDQFLFRNQGKDVVIADFGFAGGKGYKYENAFLGWPSQAKVLNCPPAFTPLKCPGVCDTKNMYVGYCQYQNLMQLESSLLLIETFILEEGKQALGKSDLTKFAGLGWSRKSNYNVCDGFSDAFVANKLSASPKELKKLVLTIEDVLAT